jgi:hypothetical protein
MADKYRYRWGPKVELKLKKTGTVAISVGDLVKRVGSNGRIQRVTASSDATALVGVAMSASPTTAPTADVIRIYQLGYGTVFEFDLVAGSRTTAWKYGQMFKLTSAQPQQLTSYLTAGSNPNASASNAVAICAQELEASGSTVYVTFMGCKYNKTVVNGA